MQLCRMVPPNNALGAALVVTLSAVVSALVFPVPVFSQTDPLQIHQTQVKAIAVQQQTQKREDHWAEQKADWENRYRSLRSEEKTLMKTKAVLEAQIEVLEARQAEGKRKIAESARIREKLQSHLDDVLSRLEGRMATDLPFLPFERAERIKAVKMAVVHPETSIAEKCRRVMETLKVETEYGQTVEVYPQAIRIDGRSDAQPVMADILRVGRLALFWRTPDGKAVGHWDRAAGRWAPLPNKYRRQINDATEMALKRRTVEMVKLPLGRIAK